MAYGDYNGPDKADKGKENGSCNRGRCQCAPARWYNHGSYAWYCDDCKTQINDAVGQRHWAKDFPNAGHPMFETREQMDARLIPSPQPKMTGALVAIAAERERQIAKGYDAAHDDTHISGEIIKAEWGALARIQDAIHAGRCGSVEGYQKSLIQAAAQIAAEYERVARAALAATATEDGR